MRVASSGENSTSLHKDFGQAHRVAGLFQALLAGELKLVLEMNIGGGEKNVNARAGGALQRLPGALDIFCAARASAAITGRRIAAATACTAAKSPSEAMGKPASMTSTPRRSS